MAGNELQRRRLETQAYLMENSHLKDLNEDGMITFRYIYKKVNEGENIRG
jgi:hypothetical protein